MANSPLPIPRPEPFLAAVGAAAFVLAVRLWVLLQLTGTVFFSQEHGDSAYYLGWARRLAQGEWSDGQAFLGLPFYPYLLGLLMALDAPFPWAPLLIQALADAATGGCIYLAVSSLPGGSAAPSRVRLRAGLAVLLWALYTPGQAYAATVMPNTLATLAFTALVTWLIRRGLEPLSPREALGAGLALGAGCLLSANLLFLAPLCLLAGKMPAASLATQALRRLGIAALLGLGIVTGSSPGWGHNYFIAHEPVALSAHGGINFFIGNSPTANGYPIFPPGIRASQAGVLEDSARIAEVAAGRPLRRYEVSAYWSAQAKAFISQNPLAWMRLLLTKARNYLSAFEYDDISTIEPLRQLGVTTPGVAFGVVALLGMLGFFLGAASERGARIAGCAVLLHLASVLPAFVTERYRLAVVPSLLIAAGAGAAVLPELFRGAWPRWRVIGFPVVALLGGWLVFGANKQPSVELLTDYNTAVRLMNAGLTAEALPLIRRVEQGGTANAEVQLLLGNFWSEAGDPKKAMRHYREALTRDPQLVRAWNNAAVIAIQEKNWSLAAGLTDHLLRLSPTDPRVHYYAAQVAQARGDLPAALAAVRRALSLRPREPLFVALEAELRAQQATVPATP